jgi:hypothetical protein
MILLINVCFIYINEDYTVVFYDAHEHEIDGYNIDDIHVPAIIPKTTTNQETDYTSLRLVFFWLSPDTIKKTFENIIQYSCITTATLLKLTFKSPNPALNVAWQMKRWNVI